MPRKSGTSGLGRGRRKKDPNDGHLIGDLLHRLSGSGKGRRKRTRTTGTSPAAYFTREGGMEKRTGSNPGTALHADHTTTSP